MSEQRTSNSENSVPTRDEGTTFDCETCRDTGEVDMTLGGYSTSDPHAKCPDCRSEERMKEQFTSKKLTLPICCEPTQLRAMAVALEPEFPRQHLAWAAAEELDRQRAEIERMRSALQWYADHMGASKSMDMRIVVQDGGKRAKDALAGSPVETTADAGPVIDHEDYDGNGRPRHKL